MLSQYVVVTCHPRERLPIGSPIEKLLKIRLPSVMLPLLRISSPSDTADAEFAAREMQETARQIWIHAEGALSDTNFQRIAVNSEKTVIRVMVMCFIFFSPR